MRKWLAVLMVMVLLVMESGFCFASEEMIESGEELTAIEKKIEAAYRAGVLEVEDVSSLFLGYKIPVYEILDNQFMQCEDVDIYPILQNGVVETLVVKSFADQTPIYTVTSMLADEMNLLGSCNKEMAVVYACDATYLWDGETFICAYEYEEDRVVEGRTRLKDVEGQTTTMEIQAIRQKERLSFDSAMTYSDDTLYQYLRVSAIPQETTTCCWAASMESFLEYVNKGADYTQNGIASQMGQSLYGMGVSTSAVKDALVSIFSVPNLVVRSQTFDFSSYVFKNLLNDYPCLGGFSSTESSTGHMAVIQGIDFESSSFSLMDPQKGTYEVGTIIVRSNYEYFSYYDYRGLSWSLYELIYDTSRNHY